MNHFNPLESIQRLCLRLSRLSAPASEQRALLGFAIGAAYALNRALHLGYSDELGAIPGAAYEDELRSVAGRVAMGSAPSDGAWLAGFYFNSALHRLAALGDRIGKYANGEKWEIAEPIRRDVNRMKHDVGGLVARARQAKICHAIEALIMCVVALELLLPRFAVNAAGGMAHAERDHAKRCV